MQAVVLKFMTIDYEVGIPRRRNFCQGDLWGHVMTRHDIDESYCSKMKLQRYVNIVYKEVGNFQKTTTK